MSDKFMETVRVEKLKGEEPTKKDVLRSVYNSLEEKGYDPYDQVIGYILSGDPTYITSHNNARNIIRDIDREDLLKEMLESYLSE
ncbi:MAG: IreB family regulatory phosphoprotein [Tissierellia bacterium]|nr:IreB family regulatory phosphoprotein [Tissierellia bacterium]